MTISTEQEAMDLFEQHRAEWLAEARALLGSKPEGTRMTVNDVRAVCPPPPDVDGRVMGSVFKKPDWVPVGYVKSSRRECHNRPIALFEKRY
jgi:hypothetical protein